MQEISNLGANSMQFEIFKESYTYQRDIVSY